MDFVNLPIENLDVKTKTINQNKVDIDLKYFLKMILLLFHLELLQGRQKMLLKNQKIF